MFLYSLFLAVLLSLIINRYIVYGVPFFLRVSEAFVWKGFFSWRFRRLLSQDSGFIQ